MLLSKSYKVISILALLVVCACQQPLFLRINSDARIGNLKFYLSDAEDGGNPIRITQLHVGHCSNDEYAPMDTLWYLTEFKAKGKELGVDYSKVPDGYKESHPAIPLKPGCYTASALPKGNIQFIVESNGSIVLRPRCISWKDLSEDWCDK